MIVPIPRGLAETLQPRRVPLASNARIQAQYRTWSRRRGHFIDALIRGKPNAVRRGWQRDYFFGLPTDGKRFHEHQTRLDIKEFSRG